MLGPDPLPPGRRRAFYEGGWVRRIGLFVISSNTGYQNLLADEGRRAARKAGLELEVFSADDTAALQSAQVVKFLHAHAADELGVVIMPVSDIGHESALDNLARKVLARGGAWIVLNRDLLAHVERMREAFPGPPVALFTIDNQQIGRLQGEQTLARVDSGASVLYVMGTQQTSAARDRRAGFLEATGSAIAVSEIEGLWSADSADKAVARWLALSGSPEFRLVACQNDPMAVGARTALHRLALERRRPEWRRLPLLGVDGLPHEGRRLVDEGVLAATVVVPPTSGTAIVSLNAVWRFGAAIPAKVVVEATPYPAGLAPAEGGDVAARP
jgi:ABC-type sugar transport system substrate-binding protein